MFERYADTSQPYKFSEDFRPTIGVDYKTKTKLVVGGENCKLQIWDTSGADRFRTITSAYYRGADGILLCFDTTDFNTFAHLESDWIRELNRCKEQHGLCPAMTLVGLKKDIDYGRESKALAIAMGISWVSFTPVLARESPAEEGGLHSFLKKNSVDKTALRTIFSFLEKPPFHAQKRMALGDAARLYAREILGCRYFEVSAKTNLNVDEAFLELATKMVAKKNTDLMASGSLDMSVQNVQRVPQESTMCGQCDWLNNFLAKFKLEDIASSMSGSSIAAPSGSYQEMPDNL